MTKTEVANMLAYMSALWTNYKPDDKTLVINVAYDLLKDFSLKETQKALKTIIDKGEKFAPQIPEIRCQILKNRENDPYECIFEMSKYEIMGLPEQKERLLLTYQEKHQG